MKPRENLKPIRFASELLPDWAQLLDVAAQLCPVSEPARRWFSRFTACSGVDDSRRVFKFCAALRAAILEHSEYLATELQRSRADRQASQILAAWIYALDTMIQETESRKTCSWIVEGTENAAIDGSDGDITLRRV